jgi:hypothetical protein
MREVLTGNLNTALPDPPLVITPWVAGMSMQPLRTACT